jgi:hypothetical protein
LYEWYMREIRTEAAVQTRRCPAVVSTVLSALRGGDLVMCRYTWRSTAWGFLVSRGSRILAHGDADTGEVAFMDRDVGEMVCNKFVFETMLEHVVVT